MDKSLDMIIILIFSWCMPALLKSHQKVDSNMVNITLMAITKLTSDGELETLECKKSTSELKKGERINWRGEIGRLKREEKLL